MSKALAARLEALVYWEDSMMGDPAFDLADLLTAPDQEDLVRWREWEPFWQLYFSAYEHDGSLPRRRCLDRGIGEVIDSNVLRPAFDRFESPRAQHARDPRERGQMLLIGPRAKICF